MDGERPMERRPAAGHRDLLPGGYITTLMGHEDLARRSHEQTFAYVSDAASGHTAPRAIFGLDRGCCGGCPRCGRPGGPWRIARVGVRSASASGRHVAAA